MAKTLPHAAAVRRDLLTFNANVLAEDLQCEINPGNSRKKKKKS